MTYKRVDHFKAPVAPWGTTREIEVARFYEGELGIRLHHCYDPANPHADHEECPSIVMGRWFALRKAWTIARFALGLYRRDRHIRRMADDDE